MASCLLVGFPRQPQRDSSTKLRRLDGLLTAALAECHKLAISRYNIRPLAGIIARRQIQGKRSWPISVEVQSEHPARRREDPGIHPGGMLDGVPIGSQIR